MSHTTGRLCDANGGNLIWPVTVGMIRSFYSLYPCLKLGLVRSIVSNRGRVAQPPKMLVWM